MDKTKQLAEIGLDALEAVSGGNNTQYVTPYQDYGYNPFRWISGNPVSKGCQIDSRGYERVPGSRNDVRLNPTAARQHRECRQQLGITGEPPGSGGF